MDDNNRDRPAGDPEEQGVPFPSGWSDMMDELFEEAVRSGSFDNLPGRGKPLKLSNNPYAPETELAYQLLKDNNYTLPWISQRQEILTRIETLRDEIGRVWRRFEPEYRAARGETIRLSLSLGWKKSVQRWRGLILEINKQITTVNLKQPGERLEIMKLTLDDELARVGAARELE